MAGARIELEAARVRATIASLAGGLEDPTPLLQQIQEYLHRIHRQRFKDQKAPDGTPWAALSPRYQKRKHRNKDRILTFRGHLSGTLVGQIDESGLQFGTNRVYGAIHQFGGEIDIAARSQQAYFKQKKTGEVGNRFVKKDRSNFAQYVTISAHKIRIPARPWLGTSEENDNHILKITRRYLENIAGA